MKRKSSKLRTVKTGNGISTLKGWAILYRGEPIAEFYGVPYRWVVKTMSLWKKLGDPYENKEA